MSKAAPKTNRQRMAKRLATYMATAASVAVAADKASAEIVYQDLDDILLFSPAVGTSVVAGLDLDDDGTIDFEIGHETVAPGVGTVLAAAGEGLSNPGGTTTNHFAKNSFYLTNLTAGQMISSSLPNFSAANSNLGYLAYGGASSCPACEFPATSTGFLGVQFDSGTTTNYGWIRVSVENGSNAQLTIQDLAYENQGHSIAAGQVPEPGCLGLLAMGGAGLLAWRRRRNGH